MEQLAFFVTKSFEYSNTTNRVLEIIKMTTKFDELDKSENQKINDDSIQSVEEAEDESVDIEITDNDVKNEFCDSKNSDKTSIEPSISPLPLIKKFRDGSKHVTKNWLISDCPKKKVTPPPSENSISIRVEDLVAKNSSSVRAKPVNELLKQIREIENESPLNESLKMEIEDVKVSGKIRNKWKLIKFN